MSMSIDTPRAGQVEQRGIELVSPQERHGRPRDLFLMWFGTNANVFYIINGAILISIGLNFTQSVFIILVGNLAFFLLGLTSLQGPRTGTATFAINRAAYGPKGGRLPAFFNWLTLIGFEGSGVALAVIALLTLAHTAGLGFAGATWFKVAILLLVAVIQMLAPTFGHATIMVVQKALAGVFGIFFLALGVAMWGKAQVSGGHPGSVADLTVGFALMVSAGGISWANTGSDYSRYLPENASPRAIFWWSSLGGYIPAVLLELLGAAVAVRLPSASDPISGLPSALPAWFAAIYLALLFANLIAVNTIDLYSSGLTLQIIGLPIRRWQATIVDLVICTVLAGIAIFSSSFNALYGEFLALLIVFLAPWCAIYLVDAWLRRNRYDARGLLQTLSGPYWYAGGFNLSGIAAQVAGMVASILWLNSPLVQGPLSRLFGNSDMSVFTGLLVGGIVYLVLSRKHIARSPQPESVPPHKTAQPATRANV